MSACEEFTVTALMAALHSGALSSRELTQEVLARIERLEPSLHAFITLIPEQALAAAAELNARKGPSLAPSAAAASPPA